jgi:DNA-binding beta-propeller fold protein YncE
LWLCSLAQTGTPARVEFNRYQATLAGLRDPVSVAVDDAGRIYVVEAGAHQVRVMTRDGSNVARFGTRGSGPGELCGPRGIAVGSGGQVYVADTLNHRVQSFDKDGRFQFSIGGPGDAPGRFQSPAGLAVDARRLYVADALNDRVQVFDRSGRSLFAFGGYGSGPGQLKHPMDVAVAADGEIYTVDQNHKLHRFDASGQHIASYGDFGAYAGFFSAPAGLACFEDKLFVADSRNHRIAAFSRDGVPLYEWGLHALDPRQGEGHLHYPSDIAIAPSGEFAVVAEAFENRCQVFARETDPSEVERRADQALFGTGGLAHYGPRASAMRDTIALVEPETDSLLLFDTSTPEPILICKFAGYGSKVGLLNEPDGIALDRERQLLYVSDAANRRIQVFSVARVPGTPLRYDPFLARFVRSIDLRAARASWPPHTVPGEVVPGALAVDKRGSLFVLDVRNSMVLVFGSDLKLERAFGGFRRGAATLWAPVDIAVDDAGERIYVSDIGANQVQVFDRQGDYQFAISRGLSSPRGIAIDADGSLLVTDSDLSHVERYSPRGDLLGSWGAAGLGPGELYKPRGIVPLDRGRVLVMDYGNHRGIMFSSAGVFERAFGPRAFVQPAMKPDQQPTTKPDK